MKRVLSVMIIVLTTTVVFSQKRESRTVSGFTGIDASGVFDITVSKGNNESLSIEADDAVMPYVRSEVKNGVLHLYLDNNDNKFKNINGIKASIVMKDLDNVTLAGACKLVANDLFTPDKFKCDCSGASNMTANLNTNQLSIETSGASKTQLKANVTGDAKLDLSGASKFKGELKASGATIDCSGVGFVELTGSASNLKMDVSGVSNVNAENFIVKTANIELSGNGNVTVNATDALKVNSSGMSTLNYKGTPTLNISSDKMTKVRKL
jgi:cytoskeletal protein CcmA (bactofilin family)